MITDYEIMEKLGSGGNAIVYSCVRTSDKRKFALKILLKHSKETRIRFSDEVRMMKEASSISGVMPIFESGSLDKKNEYWYIMPIALPVIKKVKDLSFDDIVQRVLDLAKTLETLHEKGFSHRDIKPANIYYLNNRFYLGDFGLVSFSEKDNITKDNRGLGAVFTIAPEMKRNPKEADGKKADVFSLAKTLWMLLTCNEKGFDGSYDYLNRYIGLKFFEKTKSEHLVELEQLLSKSTSHSPDARPDMSSFAEALKKYLLIKNDWLLSQKSQWAFLEKALFVGKAPQSAIWTEKEEILRILNIACYSSNLNHTLFSNGGGGLDLVNSSVAAESDCIRLNFGLGSYYIIKPQKLIFESFRDDIIWNYFYLECGELEPVLSESTDFIEYLVEDYPGHYVSAEYAQYGVYDYESGKSLPDGYKYVERCYGKQVLLIVMKSSPYNQIPSTYDGRHVQVSTCEFREYINQLRLMFNEATSKGINESAITNSDLFNKNPFTVNEKKQKPRIKNSSLNTEEVSEFLMQSFQKWDFSEIMKNQKSNISSKVRFFFQFCPYMFGQDIIHYRDIYMLSNNGFITNKNSSNTIPFSIMGKEEASKFLQIINDYVCKLLQDNDYNSNGHIFFDVSLKKVKNPYHLFSFNEFNNVVLSGDDRENNTLVVDEDGFLKLIQDGDNRRFYPVSLERWNKGNRYVGKYAILTNLEDEYLLCLEGLLEYLETGDSICKDCRRSHLSEIDLIQKIDAIL